MKAHSVIASPLHAITEVENVDYIDFLSIDIQGGEIDALNTFDWGIDVGCICIELEGHHKDRDEACRSILSSKGFSYKERLHISEFWYNPSYCRWHQLYDPEIKKGFEEFEKLHMASGFVERLRGKFRL